MNGHQPNFVQSFALLCDLVVITPVSIAEFPHPQPLFCDDVSDSGGEAEAAAAEGAC